MKTKVKDSVLTIIKMIFLVLLVSVAGVLLLTAVYYIPRTRIIMHIQESENQLRALNDDYNIANENYTAIYDTDTNIIMLQEAVSPSYISAFQDALLSPTSNYAINFGGDWTTGLMEHANRSSYNDGNLLTYPRYWHGYLIFLKPLLVFFDLQEIYQFNMIIQSVLVFLVLYLFIKRLRAFAPAYVLTIAVLNPMYIARSFQLSSIYYAMLITLMLIMLCKDGAFRKKWFCYLFLMDGILAAFFDFLTYPLVAFSIPAIVAMLLLSPQKTRTNVWDMVKHGCSFLLGYAGMWVMKWVWASIFTEENVIADGINSVLHRTGKTEVTRADDYFHVEISPMSAIVRNARSFFTNPVIALLILWVVVMIIIGVCLRRKYHAKQIQYTGILLPTTLAGISCVAWLVVLNNHCSLHPHLEYREWAIAVFAVSVIIVNIMIPKRQNVTEERAV